MKDRKLTISEWFFIIFVLVRPLTDIFVDFEIVENYININSIISLLLIFICCSAIINNVSLIKKSKFLLDFNKIFSIFLLINIHSFINTENIIISISDFLRLITVFISFNFVFIFFRGEKKRLCLVKAIIFSSIIPIGFGLYQYIFNTGNKYAVGFNRIYGTFVHPNVFAQYLIVIFFLVVFILSSYKIKGIRKYCLLFFSLIVLFEIYNTFTRTVWVVLVISILILIFIRTKISKKVIYFSLFIFVFLLLLPFVKERWADVFQKGSHSSFDWRIDLWKEIIKNFEIKNIFIGYGLGMFQYKIGVAAHNDYLKTFYETGILGLLSYIFLLFYILYVSLEKMFKSKIVLEINKYKIVTCLALSLLIMCFSDNLLRGLVVLFYYFITIPLFLNFSDNHVDNRAIKDF